jgi:putative ABC transport system substrate-binding protein
MRSSNETHRVGPRARLCAASPAIAENAENLPLVGWLRINSPDNVEPQATLFKNALAALGQVDGRNIRFAVRLAEGHAERFPELAEALVRDKASVILATGIYAIQAAKRATSTIPIVADDDDLLAEGLISSLAKPGGNTTGVSILASELDAKRLEILKEIVPAARRIALLRDPANTACPRGSMGSSIRRGRSASSFRPSMSAVAPTCH